MNLTGIPKVSSFHTLPSHHTFAIDKPEPISEPKCFYHQDKPISFFCQHPQCTLPLCEKCLPIHRVEHLNRKEIPMEKVVTYSDAKKFILQKLHESKQKVKSNRQLFEKELSQYKQKLISIIETTLETLKQQLYVQDQQNCSLKLEEITEGISNIENSNSVSHLIKSYESYFNEMDQEKGKQIQGKDSSKFRQLSIINHIKFVPDQKSLIETIERGFLHCKFVKKDILSQPKINRAEYLKAQNQTSLIERTPIQKLQNLGSSNHLETSLQNYSERSLQSGLGNPNDSFRVVQVKRQLRKSIFDQKQNQTASKKSLSFSSVSKGGIKSSKNVEKQNEFSLVKNYKLDDSSREIVLGKRKNNIYTNNVTQNESERSWNSSVEKRSVSNSSTRENQRGITLTRINPVVNDHYLVKKRESIDKVKSRLLSASDSDSVSKGRLHSSDWKRVVTLQSSGSSNLSRSREIHNNIYQMKSHAPIIKPIPSTNRSHFGEDVLNPMEMRKLLMKKRVQTMENMIPYQLIERDYQQQLINSNGGVFS